MTSTARKRRTPPARPRALVTAPLRGPGLDRLSAAATIVYEPWIDQDPLRIYNAEQLAARAREEQADLLVVESDLVSGPVWDLPLFAVASTRGDPNNVDVAGATAAGIPVLYTPGRNADAVAEMALALLLAVTRRLLSGDHDMRSGEVFRDGTIPYQRFRSWELAGRTAGLVGLGAVGRAVKWRLEALGMTVVACDPNNPDATATLDEVLDRSDVVSLHAAAAPDNVGLIGSEQLARMQDGAVLLNTARGKLVDTDALVAALTSGKLAGAGLDHVEGEMLPSDHPLLALGNVVLTPHIGGATWDTEARQAAMVAADVEALLAGARPRFIINPEVLP